MRKVWIVAVLVLLAASSVADAGILRGRRVMRWGGGGIARPFVGQVLGGGGGGGC